QFIDRRVTFVAPGQVAIQRGPAPTPGPGEALVETRRTLISTGTELSHLVGPPWTNPGGVQLPRYPNGAGYSSAGVVRQLGDGAVGTGSGGSSAAARGAEGTMDLRVGQRVATGLRHAAYPVLRQRDWWVAIPDGVDDEEAAFTTIAVIVLNGFRLGTPQLGEDAVVIGQGLL